MAPSQLVEKPSLCPRSGHFLINFSDDMRVGKITSIRTTVRFGDYVAKSCGQGGCFGCGMDAAKSKPKGGMDAANIASTRKTGPNGTFSTV